MTDRQQWTHSVEFLLALIGYSVGLGNVWRFPYTCYESGGGAFLIAYLIMWTCCGVPLMYMELAIGQYTRLGPIGSLAKMCPLFKGAGVGCVVVIGISRTLYMTLLVWPLYYLFSSFREVLPWSHCNNKWNSPNCKDIPSEVTNPSHYTTRKGAFENASAVYEIEDEEILKNVTIMDESKNDTISPSAEFFRNQVLQITSGIDNLGAVRWEFALLMLLSWILIYTAIFKGTRSIGKVVYVTVLFPYIVLIVFIIRGLTLPGSYQGMIFFFQPKWHRLADPKVWIHAASTNFFSLGFGGGGNITLASYNKRNGKIFRFTFIIASVDLLTSVMAGVAVFTNLGYLAHHEGKDIHEVVNSGTELAFIVFPEVFTTMPLSQLFSVLFYLMIITLTIDTMFVGPEIVVTAITDKYKKLPRREILTAIVCVVFYLLALPTITQGGLYYFSLLDYYVNFVSGLSLPFIEVIAVAWIYGARNLASNIKEMTGSAPNMLFVFCWYILSPLIIAAVWVFSIVKYKSFSMGSYVYPIWATALGWIVAIIPILCVLIGMVHSVYKANGRTSLQRVRNTLRHQFDRKINTSDYLDENSTLEETSNM